MHNNSISNLLGIKGVRVKNISHSDTTLTIFITTASKAVTCPKCGQVTATVHDYRNQKIKDLPMMGKHTLLVLKKRSYACSCGKRIMEQYDFLPKYSRMTNRLCAYICKELRRSTSLTDIANILNLSVTTIARVFDHIQYPRLYRLPKVLAIDEFKGNADTGKYQCILVDPHKKRVLDILPDRRQQHLITYFKQIPKSERQKVKFFVCDMWRPYMDIARLFFPSAKIIVDKYHFVRQVIWAMERVRKRVQKALSDKLRRHFKRSRSLMLKRYHHLDDDQKEHLGHLLLHHDDLRTAYRLKEEFLRIGSIDKYSECRKAFADWIAYAESTTLPEFRACIRAFRNWHKEILNAYKHAYTNGPTEGFNNKIKVLKRVSYGIRNVDRFRNRILHICN